MERLEIIDQEMEQIIQMSEARKKEWEKNQAIGNEPERKSEHQADSDPGAIASVDKGGIEGIATCSCIEEAEGPEQVAKAQRWEKKKTL